ncbi:MAG: carbohydrate-binding domain-containing protein [Bacteroidales bacterium]|nr:carbohydrate-binding domain-containing protein [Bacteroidales bacterium]
MKQILFFALLFSILLTGCKKDSITIIEPTDSTIEDGSDDYSGETFEKSISVEYSTSGNATVSGADSTFVVTIDNNQVTIVYSGSEQVEYELSGTSDNGFFKLYSAKKQSILLNNLSLTNPNGAAINVQGTMDSPNSGKRTFVVVNGSNKLADGSSYSQTPSGEDEKGVVFGEGKLVFCGDGNLSITASGKSGIVSDDYVRFTARTEITIKATNGHGVKGKDSVMVDNAMLDILVSANMKKGLISDGTVRIDGGNTTITVSGNAAYDSEDKDYSGTAGVKAGGRFEINGGTLVITNSGTGGKGISGDGNGNFNGGTISVTTTGSNYSTGGVSAKGIKFDGDITFSGTNVSVDCKSNEGIESKGTITISDGIVYSYSAADDAMNSSSDFTITGGFVCGYATSNDGLDANGDFYIKGGLVYAIGASSPEVAIDANTEEQHKLYVEGGTIIAIGGLERGSSLTQNCYQVSSWTQNTWYNLSIGTKNNTFKTPQSGGSGLVVSGSSTPELTSGVTVSGGTIYFDGMLVVDGFISDGESVSLSSYTSESGGGPGGNQGGPGGNTPPNGRF